MHYIATHSPSGQDRPKAGRYFGVLHHQGFGVLHQLCPLQLRITVRLAFFFTVSVTAHVFVYIKLLSTGACANITIREIMLINIISSASWTLQVRCLPLSSLSAPAADPSPGTHSEHRFPAPSWKDVVNQCLEFAPGTALTLQRG